MREFRDLKRLTRFEDDKLVVDYAGTCTIKIKVFTLDDPEFTWLGHIVQEEFFLEREKG